MSDNKTHLYIFGYERLDRKIVLGNEVHRCSWAEAHNKAAKEILNAIALANEYPEFTSSIRDIFVIELPVASVVVNPATP